MRMKFALMDELTERERKYVQARLVGMTPSQAAKQIGATRPSQEAEVIEARPRVFQALQRGFEEARQRFQVSREDVVSGIQEGIEIARLTSDAGNVIKGWTEIARICGLIAPAKAEVTVSTDQPLLPSKLRELPTAQLLQLVGKQRELEILEAEFEEVTEEESTDGEAGTDRISDLHPGTDRGAEADTGEGGAAALYGVRPTAAEEEIQDDRSENESAAAGASLHGLRVAEGGRRAPRGARGTRRRQGDRRRSEEDDQGGPQGEGAASRDSSDRSGGSSSSNAESAAQAAAEV